MGEVRVVKPEPDCYSREHIEERLNTWRDCWHDAPTEKKKAECLGAIDRWLEELADLIGR